MLELQGIIKVYGSKKSVDNISFLDPNGVGKTQP
jgi:ABC-type uncharacterized transport system ATPase subunit